MALHKMEPVGTQWKCKHCHRVGFLSLRHIQCPAGQPAPMEFVEVLVRVPVGARVAA